MALLAGLEAVPWQTLIHAYGPAGDVPALLCDLASNDGAVREHAREALYSNIYHQGSIYEATAYAVPFLLELLQDDSVADRREILILLVHLAHGHSYWDVHQHMTLMEKERGKPEFQAKVAVELHWVAETYRAVRAGSSVYKLLLDHPEAVLREGAAYLLSSLIDQTAFDEVVPTLLARLDGETNERVRATLLHGIGLQVPIRIAQRMVPEDSALQYAQLLAQYVQAERENELVRLVAAMALARVAATSVAHTQIAAQALLPILVHRSDKLAQLYEDLPWVDRDIAGDICTALAVLNPSVAGGAVIPDLLRSLDAADGFTALTIANALLYIAFRQSGHSARVNMHDLTGDQIVVLETLANEHSPCWKINVNMADILRSYGLPDWPDKLRDALASRSP